MKKLPIHFGALSASVLTYAVTEPEQWTVDEIADDLDAKRAEVANAVQRLRMRGLVRDCEGRKGEKIVCTEFAPRILEDWQKRCAEARREGR